MSFEHIFEQSEIPRKEQHGYSQTMEEALRRKCRPWRKLLDVNVIIKGRAVLYYNCLGKHLFSPLELTPKEFISCLFSIPHLS